MILAARRSSMLPVQHRCVHATCILFFADRIHLITCFQHPGSQFEPCTSWHGSAQSDYISDNTTDAICQHFVPTQQRVEHLGQR